MLRSHFSTLPVVLTVVVFCPVLACAEVYQLTVAGERLEFVAQPQRGYVVKLPAGTGGISALSDVSLPDAERARRIRGRDRRGMWAVENYVSATENERTMATLRQKARAAYVAPLFSSHGQTVAVIPEIVVRVRPGIEMGEVQALCQAAGCVIEKRMEFTDQEYLLEVLGPNAEAVFVAVEMLNHRSEVEWACPNTAFRPKLAGQRGVRNTTPDQRIQMASSEDDPDIVGVFPNDEYFPMQWHLHNAGQSGGTRDADINAPEAWEITAGDPNIVVAVIDSGVDTNHPDLINNLVPGYDFWEDDDLPDPAHDDAGDAHGTACAGLIAAQGNNLMGVTGVAWGCKIMPVRPMDPDADGYSPETEADDAEALRWAAVHGADILSNSWSFSVNPTPILHSAIVDITRPDGLGRGGRGCVVVFSAGNGGEGLWYPQRYAEVIGVGATDHNDVRYPYSNYGPTLDMVAPSGCSDPRCSVFVDLWTTDISGSPGLSSDPYYTLGLSDYVAFDGTSASAPIVAGAAALVLSTEPELTNDEVRHFLERSARDLGDPGWDEYYGWGRVDARAALDMVLAKRGDLNNDWVVDEEDEAIMIQAIDANDLSADIAPAAKRDGVVDANDLALLTQYLGTEIPELGLIARWTLDETAGTIAHDSAGEYHDATVEDDPLWLPDGGMIQGALQLDGIDDCVSTPSVVDPADGPFSVFAWIEGGAPGQVIVSQADGDDWLMADPSAGRLMTTLQKPRGRTPVPPLVSEVVVTDGQWHRVGLAWDGTDRILYVDDLEVARDTQAAPAGSSGGLYLGCDRDQETGTFFSGLIDDVRVYDRAVRP